MPTIAEFKASLLETLTDMRKKFMDLLKNTIDWDFKDEETARATCLGLKDSRDKISLLLLQSIIMMLREDDTYDILTKLTWAKCVLERVVDLVDNDKLLSTQTDEKVDEGTKIQYYNNLQMLHGFFEELLNIFTHLTLVKRCEDMAQLLKSYTDQRNEFKRVIALLIKDLNIEREKREKLKKESENE